MDFFSAAQTQDPVGEQSDPFAQAIEHRFGTSAILTARLDPGDPRPPPAPMPTLLGGTATFRAVAPAELDPWLADPKALILDIRPHAAHSSARIPGAVSLSVPSTLLKRPLFSLERLSTMLPSQSARIRFAAWRTASRILVYDADSNSLHDSSNILGLLRKFHADAFPGDLFWLQGGFQAVWKVRRDLLDTTTPAPDLDNDDDDDDPNSPAVLRTRHLPISAFSFSSTTASNRPSHPLSLTPNTSSTNPFFDAVRQNVELSHGITDRIPLRLPRRVRRRIHDLPFPWLQAITRRAENAPARHHPSSDSSTSDSEGTDDPANATETEEGKEALAMQFYKIELAEQRRLMGIMDHHSKESGQSNDPSKSSTPFAFSITAGVEKGDKNRYRHIWPFEHARVRLHQASEASDDYINASYVQPLGTRKRYIATQGPLPATFTDFWTLCWEQRVHVIVMLTREVEGSMVKCGAYWSGTEFGPFRLRLVSTEGLAPPEEHPYTAHTGSFSSSSSRSIHRRFPHSAGSHRRYRHHHYRTNRAETVKRTFELTHTGYPQTKPRRIIHLQYLEWPDMNVPEDPRGVLGLVKQVEDAVQETRDADGYVPPEDKASEPPSLTEVDEKTGISKHALQADSPVLLHCSAGVGRTGGFIAVDAILDAIRREVRQSLRQPTQPDQMEVDAPFVPHGRLTMPIKMSSGKAPSVESSHVPFNHQPSGPHVVHVPLASAMEIDGDSSPSPERGQTTGLKTRIAGTLKWAETVRRETGVEGIHRQSPGLGPANPTNSTSATPAASSSYPKSSDNLTATERSYGSYRPSSSSLETSVSGSSSIHKENHLSASIAGVMVSDAIANDSHPTPGKDTTTAPKQAPPDTVELKHPIAQVRHRIPMEDSLHTAKTFDYIEPRQLHRAFTPPLLSTYEDPIWEVIQDMREQRMSLCQSLRQYVFVHAAIVEGALMVVDEEREYAEGLVPRNSRNMPPIPNLQSNKAIPRLPLSAVTTPTTERVGRSRSRSSSRSRRHVNMTTPTHYTSTHYDSTTSPNGKRSASPTELKKVDKSGEVMLSKRPSIKRKHRSGEDHSQEQARYHPVPNRLSSALQVGDGSVPRQI